MQTKDINAQIKKLKETNDISDGYHTFGELYEHRIVLFIKLCEARGLANHSDDLDIWRSKLHADGTMFDGWFIMGINREKGKQITYHLPIERWVETECFAKTLDKAPKFDGHTPEDVLKRIKAL